MNSKDGDMSGSKQRARTEHPRDGINIFIMGLVSVGVGAALAVLSPTALSADSSGKPCARTDFQTVFVKEACAKGQKNAKKEMKDWVKKAKKQKAGLECATCHSEMAPDYPLKPDGVKLFKELGGK